jgi:lysophospholipase L1-like esterase
MPRIHGVPMRAAALALFAAAIPRAAGAAAGERVLPPGAAAVVQRAFARAAPALRLAQAAISADHVDAVVCAADARCYPVRLDDPREGCDGAPAGPFCVRFPGEAPPPAVRDALVRAFSAEPPDACWQELAVHEEPRAARDPVATPRGAPAAKAVVLAWLALTVAPFAAGGAIGWLAARIRGRPLSGKALGGAILVVPTLIAAAAALRQLALGLWDLALAGALLGTGAIVAGYGLTRALRTKRAALVAGSVGLALLAGEVAVRALGPPPGVDPAEVHRLYFDAHEADVAFTRFELWEQNDGHLGWTGTLKEALYPDAGLRVLHLGDSMVYGLGVERGEAFPARLAALEPGVAHVNAGIPGLAPDAEWLLARRWLERARFDLVVLHLFTGNDIKEMDTAYPFCADGPLLDYDASPPRPRCPSPGRRFPRSRLAWMLAHSPPPYALRALAGRSALASRSALGLLSLRARLFGEKGEEARAWAHLEAVLRAFRDDLAARRIPLVVDVLPLRDALEARDPSSTEAYATRTRMVEVARSLGIPVLDPWDALEDAVKREGSDRWFSTAMPHDLHFGPEGHALLARWLDERLPAASGVDLHLPP